ncbi:MAG: ABC transporter permease [Thermoprotei archaeon]|nr:ABC transporter permease [Thermoprotei archaeon]
MSDLKRFLLRRALTFIPTVIGVTFLVFFIAAVLPADPAKLWAGGEKANPQVVENIKREYRLDRPIWEQYFFFLKNVVTNEMVSPVSHNKVWEDLGRRLPVTIQLTLLSFTFIVSIGIPLGILSALKRDSVIDMLVRILALLGVSTPVFWLAYLLIFIFFTRLGWITLAGTPVPPYSITGIPLIDSIIKLDFHTFKQVIERYWLPSLVLAYANIGVIARLVRNSFLDALSSDFVEFIDARGLSSRRKYVHVLKNAMVPVITVLGLTFGGLLAGAPITETVFGLPGVGRYLIDAIRFYDYLTLMGGVLLIALIYVTVNLLVDISYAIIDPRVRY